MYNPQWLTLSNALRKSIEHTLAVLPFCVRLLDCQQLCNRAYFSVTFCEFYCLTQRWYSMYRILPVSMLFLLLFLFQCLVSLVVFTFG